jgi:hypothetical protein
MELRWIEDAETKERTLQYRNSGNNGIYGISHECYDTGWVNVPVELDVVPKVEDVVTTLIDSLVIPQLKKMPTMKAPRSWKLYKDGEPTAIEVVLEPTGQVSIAMWSNSPDQYIDIELSDEQTDQLQVFLNSRKAV